MEAVMDALKDLLLAGLSVVLMLATKAVKEWFEENKNNKTLQSVNEILNANEAIVKIAVAAVEQTYKELHGNDKLEAAKHKAIRMLNEKGLPFSESEIDALIHKTVKEMNDKKN